MPLQEVGREVKDWASPPRPSRVTLEGNYVRLEPLDAAPARSGPCSTPLPRTGAAVIGPIVCRARSTGVPTSRLGGSDRGRHGSLYFAYVDRETGLAAGMGAFMTIAPSAGSIEIGSIMLAPAMQGRRERDGSALSDDRLGFQRRIPALRMDMRMR